MSKLIEVSRGQADIIRKIANEKKVSRESFQAAINDGSFARFLDDLKNGQVDLGQIVFPPGARHHVVRVKVKLDREWQEAITAAGPNTPDHYNVRKVGDLYPPTGTQEIEEDLILINYPNGDGFDAALTWAKSQHLENTVPREVFAIGEQHPKLHEVLGQNPMYVAATKECSFGRSRGACYVWWSDSEREALLSWVGSFLNSNDWFAFRKPVLKTKAS